MGGDLNDLDLCDCVLYSDDRCRNFCNRRYEVMSAICGTIVVIASVCIMLAPWIAEEISDLMNR